MRSTQLMRKKMKMKPVAKKMKKRIEVLNKIRLDVEERL
jgi:hypothetical protein